LAAFLGQTLRSLRVGRGVSQDELSDAISVDRTTVSTWEVGGRELTRANLTDIAVALRLSRNEADYLLQLAGYDDLSPEELARLRQAHAPAAPALPSPEQPPGAWRPDPAAPPAAPATDVSRRMTAQLHDLQDSLQNAATQVSADGTLATPGATSIRQEVENALLTVLQLRETSRELNARVIPPAPEDMEVRLMSTESLHRLDEYRSEEQKWMAVACVFLGAGIGIVVNIATGARPTDVGWAMLVLFSLFTILCAVTTVQYGRRARRLREHIQGRGGRAAEGPGR
jgi:transcriptional regulator with XRE-family HTH domain